MLVRFLPALLAVVALQAQPARSGNSLDYRLGSMEAKIDAILTRMDKLDGRMDRLETKVDSLGDRVGKLEERTGKIEEKVSFLNLMGLGLAALLIAPMVTDILNRSRLRRLQIQRRLDRAIYEEKPRRAVVELDEDEGAENQKRETRT